jgi:hypothetical protein
MQIAVASGVVVAAAELAHRPPPPLHASTIANTMAHRLRTRITLVPATELANPTLRSTTQRRLLTRPRSRRPLVNGQRRRTSPRGTRRCFRHHPRSRRSVRHRCLPRSRRALRWEVRPCPSFGEGGVVVGDWHLRPGRDRLEVNVRDAGGMGAGDRTVVDPELAGSVRTPEHAAAGFAKFGVARTDLPLACSQGFIRSEGVLAGEVACTRPGLGHDIVDDRRVGRRRPARTRDPHLGALVQRAAPSRSLRARPPSRVRSSVLCCPTARPRQGWNPIARASIKPRAIHFRVRPIKGNHTVLAPSGVIAIQKPKRARPLGKHPAGQITRKVETVSHRPPRRSHNRAHTPRRVTTNRQQRAVKP